MDLKTKLLADMCKLRAELQDSGDPHFRLPGLERELAYVQRTNIRKGEVARIRWMLHLPGPDASEAIQPEHKPSSVVQADKAPPSVPRPEDRISDPGLATRQPSSSEHRHPRHYRRSMFERWCVHCDKPLTREGDRFTCTCTFSTAAAS